MKTNTPIPNDFNNSKQVAAGKEAEFLEILRTSLDIGIGILDENMDYQFISDSLYRQLHISPSDLQVGDNVDKCHALMIENGMIDQKFLDHAKLTGDAQRTRLASDSLSRNLVLTLGDGATHRFSRKEMDTGYILSTSDDVSELIEKDKLLEDALRLGISGYWMLDINTQEYFLSDSLDDYFSDEDKILIAKYGMTGILHKSERGVFWRNMSALDGECPKAQMSLRLMDRDSKPRYADLTIELLQDKHGNWNKVRAFTVDRTEFYLQQEALETAKNEAIAATKAKSSFLANMSHEIRTPLNGVMGMAELLSRTDVSERQRDYVNIINQSATQLLSIINDILDFSRVEAGEMLLESGAVNLRQTVEDTCALLTPMAQEQGLEIILNYPESVPENFKSDTQRITQILTNLIGNSAKFTNEGYISIDVSVTEMTSETGLVIIKVTDTGIGIPEENLSSIFGKFTQVDGSSTRKHGGTGLGLSITKSLVDLMRGRIKVSSELGKGSQFCVYLPLEYDEAASPQVTHEQTLTGAKILIVDDIKVNRQILSEMLDIWGVEAKTADSAASALSILKLVEGSDRAFDLIITDHLMPGMNGKDFARTVMEDQALTNTPMIMLSSCNQDMSLEDLKAMGIEHYLNKPARSERLYETLSSALSKIESQKNESNRPVDILLEKIHGVPDKSSVGFCEILVAEDIKLNQDIVCYMLEGSPYNPTITADGKLAVDAFKADPHRFKAILMDISMPVMDGIEATKHIREIELELGLPPTPIIALTGHALKGDREKFISGGLDDYITKPVNQVDLLEILGKWISYSKNPDTAVA